MPSIIAIDPGPERSAYAILSADGDIRATGIDSNGQVDARICAAAMSVAHRVDRCAIEMVASYGKSVGASVFATCVWIGRFASTWDTADRVPADLITRMKVKMHLCHAANANDSNIRQAIMDMYGSTRAVAIGTKKNPGPLHGVAKDMWAALALAITYRSILEERSEVTP